MAAEGPGFGKIEHFFVLMLENRSFDHMFGAAGFPLQNPLAPDADCPLDPANPKGGTLPMGFGALDTADPDPPHEFADVYFQVAGKTAGGYAVNTPLPMDGFVASARHGLLEGEGKLAKWRKQNQRGNGGYALECQRLDSIPVLRTLAREFALCDNWYSSMPGPTWPNRFFIHAASAGGLTNSPSAATMGAAVLVDKLGFDFEHGTIYDRLGDGNWRVYHGDAFPQVLAITGMARSFAGAGRNRFRRIAELSVDLQDDMPRYVFIEPNHSIMTGSRRADSQHPPGRVSAGEDLIKRVYDALRQSKHWSTSALIIVYDEHGGFYDHKPPPVATPPGDAPLNAEKAQFQHPFGFDRFGVRVPAIVVSPLIEPGTIDSTPYDHTSVLKTVEQRFGLDPLTERDKAAEGFAHLFTRTTARDDIPDVFAEVPAVPESIDEAVPGEPEEEEPAEGDLAAGSLAGFLRIATLIDHLENVRRATLTQRAVHYLFAARFPAVAITRAPVVQTRQQARAYIAEVARKVGELAPVEAGV